MFNAYEYTLTRLLELRDAHTTVVLGVAVSRHGDRYELGTLGRHPGYALELAARKLTEREQAETGQA